MKTVFSGAVFRPVPAIKYMNDDRVDTSRTSILVMAWLWWAISFEWRTK